MLFENCRHRILSRNTEPPASGTRQIVGAWEEMLDLATIMQVSSGNGLGVTAR